MSMICRLTPLSPSRLEELINGTVSTIDLLFPQEGTGENGHALDIDKSWHAIHFLLTGDPWDGEHPYSSVVLGGTPFGEDLGYGPARFLVAEDVAEIAHVLAEISPAILFSRYSAQRFQQAEIYPHGEWPETLEPDGYFVEYYRLLQQFYRDAAQRGDCVVLSLS